jgi:hypothetical protein
LNAQRYLDEILRTIVMPFIHHHHLMFQHDNAWPHVTRIGTQFLEAENGPILPWSVYSPDMSPIEHVWDALNRHVWQRIPVCANIQQLRTAKRILTTFHRPPSTAWSTLCEDVSQCMKKMVVTPDTDWFSDTRPYLFLRYLWPTDAYLYSQSCETHRLGPHLFISIDWFAYMNCNSVKSLTLLHVAFIFLFSVHLNMSNSDQ